MPGCELVKRVSRGEDVLNRPCNRSCQVLNQGRHPIPGRRLPCNRKTKSQKPSVDSEEGGIYVLRSPPLWSWKEPEWCQGPRGRGLGHHAAPSSSDGAFPGSRLLVCSASSTYTDTWFTSSPAERNWNPAGLWFCA